MELSFGLKTDGRSRVLGEESLAPRDGVANPNFDPTVHSPSSEGAPSQASAAVTARRAARRKRSLWQRRAQLAIGCCAIGLPLSIALILDQTDFLDEMHLLWWIAFSFATAGCFVLLPWSERGFPKLLLTGGIFGVVNAVLFISTPGPGKSIYWECADMVSGLFVSSAETPPVLPLTPNSSATLSVGG